jgi:SAM-dependent methyltransferase
MTNAFGKDYWESHWESGGEQVEDGRIAPNPYLEIELVGLTPGTALDAGCGEGAEATWLAARDWQVTAADISAEALHRAAAQTSAAAERVEWVEADLSAWQPSAQFDLVTTFYAHPAMPQLSFYQRIGDWVAPGGTLLIVGHLDAHGHGHNPPVEALVTAANVTAVLDPAQWHVITAEERDRTLDDRSGRPVPLRDVVVRATRRTSSEPARFADKTR